MKKNVILLLSLTMLAVILLGCASKAEAPGDLMTNIEPKPAAELAKFTPDGSEPQAVCDFAVQLLQQSWQQDNTLVSPLSVILALAMTANGAADETLAQMEEVFGLPLPQLNGYLQAYIAQLPQGEKYKLSAANSIWIKENTDFTVKPEFLQTNADYYQASVYQAPFDSQTVQQVNDWVKQHTDGMIDSIIQEFDREDVFCLINALAFDAEWAKIYEEHQVRPDIFTTEDGQKQEVDFMYSTEYSYLQDENTQGFIKYYADRQYAFAALLPNEGIAMQDYLASLNGEKLYKLLNNPQDVEVRASLPKFESESTLELNEPLQNMGLTEAFNKDLADFSAMASWPAGYNLYISDVLHKTYIKVDEKGTKAGAATAVIMAGNTAAVPPREFKTVRLDRPFVYLLIDCHDQLPLFIGTVMSVK